MTGLGRGREETPRNLARTGRLCHKRASARSALTRFRTHARRRQAARYGSARLLFRGPALARILPCKGSATVVEAALA